MTESDQIEGRVWRIAAVTVLGSHMSVLDMTIVNVGLATISRELHSSIEQAQWAVSGYMLALAAVIPVTGWTARRFGTRRVFMVAIVAFTAASGLCAVASSMEALIVFRILQGACGGFIYPTAHMIVANAAGPKRFGRVMSIVAVPGMLVPILGPTLGALIVGGLGWRWIFWVNIPVGIVALIAAWRVLPRDERTTTARLDVVGFALMATGLVLLTYGLVEIGATGGVTSRTVIGTVPIGLLLIGAFFRHAASAEHPLLDVLLYRRRMFASASVLMLMIPAAGFGVMILLPLYWQNVRHESLIATGMLVVPQSIGMTVVLPLAGKLSERWGGGLLALLGVSIMTVSTVPLARLGTHTSIVWLSAGQVVRGVGLGLAFIAGMSASYAALNRSEISDATPQLNVVQRVGGAMGTALLAVILARALAGEDTASGTASAYTTAFWCATALTALTVVPCFALIRAERVARKATTGAPSAADVASSSIQA